MELSTKYLNSESINWIQSMVELNALFCVNHSGGKDSQCMLAIMAEMVPPNQLVIVHAHLPEVEWEGTIEHIEATAPKGYEIRVCQSVKTFFQMVEHRGMFPDAHRRQCTSDLKRGPLEKLIRAISKERSNKLIVNCMGMRAQESTNRRKLRTLKYSFSNSKAGRDWFDFLPIHQMLETSVFDCIKESGHQPFYTYLEGMSRKSCCFCILANRSDLQIAARLRPELAERYCQTEERLDFTLQMSKIPLRQLIAKNNDSVQLELFEA